MTAGRRCLPAPPFKGHLRWANVSERFAVRSTALWKPVIGRVENAAECYMQRFFVMQAYIGSKSFYKGALKVMIPVTIQQLINAMFNMVDSLMVGSLDVNGLTMSAVSVANKPYTMYWAFFFGMSGAAGLMISQYFGADDRKTCQGLLMLQMVIGSVMALVVGMLLVFFPEGIMRLFVTDPETVALGVKYLRIIWISYIPTAISNIFVYSTRSVGQNKVSMLVSMLAMAVNAFCNYVLIFGKLGLPAMGVEGAAIGTVIARTVEMLIYLTMLARKKTVFSLEIMPLFHLKLGQVKTFITRAAPLILNEIFWQIGTNLYFWSYARINEAGLPAFSMAEQITMVAYALAMGSASAVSVLIGAELGANRLQEAKANCKKLLTLMVVIGLIVVALLCVMGMLLPNAFSVTPALRGMATRITVIMAVFAPFNFLYSFCFYCLRAGGDTQNAMLLDSGYLWIAPVPAALLMAFLLPGKISIDVAVFVVQLLASGKVVLGLWVLKKGKWLRNITETA